MKMKGTKFLTSLIALTMVFSVVFGLIQGKAYAANDEIYVGVSPTMGGTADGPAYGIGDPTDGTNAGKYIWDLISYTSDSYDTLLENQKDLYCVKGGIGFTAANASNSDPQTYTHKYNLRTNKSDISGLFNDTTDSHYVKAMYENYSSILCLLDNMYIPSAYNSDEARNAAKSKILELAGIDTTDYTYPITDEDIEVVQQLALWYFTNTGDAYHNETLDDANIYYKNSSSEDYDALIDYLKFDGEVGEERHAQMSALYDYLLDYATSSENKTKYDSIAAGEALKLNEPVSINGTSFDLSNSTDSSYNLVGPITITKNNNRPYIIEFEVKNNSGVISSDNYTFVNASETEVDKDTATGNIYIKIPKTYGEELTVKVTKSYTDTDATLWFHNSNFTLQPLIEVTGEPVSVPEEYTVTPTVEPKIDLALRKFITAVSSDANGDFSNTEKTTTYSREPVVSDLDKLKAGTTTTATYSHSKETVKVKNGDYIEYTIRVYNEGEVDGYAEEITDYILRNTGLQFESTHPTNIAYGWTVDGNKVKTNYLSHSNTSNKLEAFDDSRTTLDSRDVKIVFKVVKPDEFDYATKLVNIAEITDDADENGNDIEDRDSTPGTDSKGYPDSGYNTENHEDDIDYEPVELYKFDLALRKFITAVSDDATIEEDEILTGTNSREPVVTYEDGKLVYTHPKDPVSVKAGDYVLYTIRVYNEGEIDGYASSIEDTFQDGLEFVTSDSTYNGIWSIDSGNPNRILTNWLARDCERNKISGVVDESLARANGLLKAFDKDSAISTTEGALNPDYKDVQVLLHVKDNYQSTDALYNRAQVENDSDENGNPVDDIDSTPSEWIEGEDDQDYDPVILETFDLSLRKYITQVDDTVIENRRPDIDTTTLVNGNTAKYNHTKQPVEVTKGSVISYTLTAYNEGTVDGYASEITDYIPEGLEYIDNEVNSTTNGWKMYKLDGTETTDPSEARIIKTDVLKDQKIAKRDTNTGDAENPYTLHCYSVQVQLKVKDDATTGTSLTNIAEISEYRYKGNADSDIVIKDIDSKSDSLTDGDSTTGTLPSDEELPNYNGGTDTDTTDNYVPGQQDDDDFEKVIVKPRVDLALTKFITAISADANIEDGEYLTANGSEGSRTNPYTRATAVNTNPLLEGGHDAIYTQDKSPLTIANGSYILYNIRVYNEGEVNVYAGEVTDYLPDGIEFVEGEFNNGYGWTLGEDGKTVSTEYLSKDYNAGEVTIERWINSFDKTTDQGAGEGLDYKDLPILCKVNNTAKTGVKLVNSAEITEYEDETGAPIEEDIDSKPNDLPDEDKNKEGKPEGRYDHEGQDDEDYDVVIIKKVDLALTKFITAISSDEKIDEGEYLSKDKTSVNAGTLDNPYDRQTAVDTTPLKNGENDAIYKQVKEPALNVNRGYYVLYNIRVYNEGQVDVYAGEVTDYLPENLEFVDGDFNKQYGWEADGQTVKTSYLKYVEENKGTEKDQILKAFDSANDDGAGSGLDFKDLPILCRVSEKTESGKPLVNIAEVTKYEDEEGNELPNDVDSTPDNVDKKNEDDDDYETVIVEEFDLSLLKYVSQVIVTEDGKTTTTETHNTGNNATDIIPKVEIHRKKINTTSVKFVYTIRITNEGDIEGYAKEITDYVPEGLAFYTEDNTNWTVKSEGVIATRELENTLLKPGESADVQVTFRWINGANNLSLKRNTAEISEDYNEKGVPDRDSTPNNKVDGEDDIDIADVLLSIKTGRAATYVMLVGVVLIVLASGIILVKKYSM